MSERLIRVVVHKEHVRPVTNCLTALPAENRVQFPAEDGARAGIVAALHRADTQSALDAISDALQGRTGWQLHALPAVAALPETRNVSELERVATVNIAAQVVFRLKGMRPRRWKSAHQVTRQWVSFGVSAAIVALLALGVYATGHGWMNT